MTINQEVELRTVKLCLLCAICFLISVISCYASEESLTITTYYPSPYGSYRELRSQRIAIGETYINGATYSWDNGTINANADLVVEGNVGIGTPDPQATLQLNGTAKIFGTPITSGLSPSVVYQAASDGFVSAFSNKDTAWVRAFTGPTNPPAIEWGRHTKAGEGGVLMPVRKGEYWMVTITEEPQIRWIPFGN